MLNAALFVTWYQAKAHDESANQAIRSPLYFYVYLAMSIAMPNQLRAKGPPEQMRLRRSYSKPVAFPITEMGMM